MSLETKSSEHVRFERNAVRIYGEPVILLCASLFYFRIPRAYWKERMEQLKAFGYNGIDVYFPWNYHELSENEWHFEGERDAAAFLEEAAAAGLWVIARPGPYICSEWDGGSLPAYLFVDEGMKLRDNDPAFLQATERWFDRILPVIASNQLSAGGTVIAVQLDNELDFYDCGDPAGYMAALRDMARRRGIDVPLFACAGQGGIQEATGLAEGVMPTCNFYPDNRDPEFESKVLQYRARVDRLGYPLLVTETNRSHYLLRRLLSCGAKLLGPYLQVSGTDFGFTNSTNNWGKPLAFMTSDYDFGGMISPEGHIREEAYEGRLLGRLLQAYGQSLAEAAVMERSGQLYGLDGDTAGMAELQTLSLKGGGSLLFATNLEDRSKTVRIRGAEQPAGDDIQIGITLAGGRSLALPCDVPLALWGLGGSLTYSTAELFMAMPLQAQGGTAALLFHSEGKGAIRLQLDAAEGLQLRNATAERLEDGLIIRFDGREAAACLIDLGDGRQLKVHILPRVKALYTQSLDTSAEPVLAEPFVYNAAAASLPVEWRVAFSTAEAPASARLASETEQLHAEPLEMLGIFRGFAWYEAPVQPSEEKNVYGVLIRQASDVISLHADGAYIGTAAPGGATCYMPLDGAARPISRLSARTEIWGHSNFDDIRLPGLRLNAMKGLSGLTAVTDIRDLSRNWHMFRSSDRTVRREWIGPDADNSLWPIVSFGGWLSPDHPAFEYYSRSFTASEGANSWTLHFKGLQSHARLFVGGSEAGAVNPFDPFVDITPYVAAGETVHLTVFVERVLGLPSGGVVLYEGTEAAGWQVQAAAEPELLRHAESLGPLAMGSELPLELSPGSVAWLYADVPHSGNGKGWRLDFEGSGLKLTVFLEERNVGRLWLEGGEGRPTVTGGSASSAYLPGAWFGEHGGKLAIMLEAVDIQEAGRLARAEFLPVQQLERE